MSIRILPKSGRTVVRCHTEGRSGREYEVTFDREGLVVSVVNISMYGMEFTGGFGEHHRCASPRQ